MKIEISVKVKRNIAVCQASIVGGLNKHLMSSFTSSSLEKVGKPKEAWVGGRVCFERHKETLEFFFCCLLLFKASYSLHTALPLSGQGPLKWNRKILPIETLVQHATLVHQNEATSCATQSAQFPWARQNSVVWQDWPARVPALTSSSKRRLWSKLLGWDANQSLLVLRHHHHQLAACKQNTPC